MGMYSEIDSPMYIFEYLGGEVTGTPDSIVKVIHAIGGWNMGHHEISLNAAEDAYFLHLKNTLGPSRTNRHEGLKHFGIRRTPDFAYVNVTDGNACGPGHVLANRMVYNEAADAWSQLCTLDLCAPRHQYENGACRSVSWYTVPGVTKEPQAPHEGTELLSMDTGFDKQWKYSGGGAAILSLGLDGWLALALGPGTPETEPKPETIGFLPLPLTVPELKEQGTEVRVPLYGADEDFGTVTRYALGLARSCPIRPLNEPRTSAPASPTWPTSAPMGKTANVCSRVWSPSTETAGHHQRIRRLRGGSPGPLARRGHHAQSGRLGRGQPLGDHAQLGLRRVSFAWTGSAPGATTRPNPATSATTPGRCV